MEKPPVEPDLAQLAPLVRVITDTMTETPVALGSPQGIADLAAMIAVRVAVYVGKEVLPPAPPAPDRGELWSLLDWTFWGSGMGDVFREPLADTMLAAISPEQREQAEALMTQWHASGREPLGRRRYEDLSSELAEARAKTVDLSDNDRQLLTFALELAADQMASRSDEFDDADTAALEKLRQLASKAHQTEQALITSEHVRKD